MSVRKEIDVYSGVFFITLTCCRWLPLFDESSGYDAVYKWFEYLKKNGHYICGYVIMPNHLHVLVTFRNTQGQSINSIVGNGKRFMAYDLVKRLKYLRKEELLKMLGSFVDKKEKLNGKLHEVFEPSFDWKECMTEKFVEQKLNYIHENPCRGKWNLVEHPEDYVHSSAGYYLTGRQGLWRITSYMEIDDVDLTRPLIGEN